MKNEETTQITKPVTAKARTDWMHDFLVVGAKGKFWQVMTGFGQTIAEARQYLLTYNFPGLTDGVDIFIYDADSPTVNFDRLLARHDELIAELTDLGSRMRQALEVMK